MKFHKGLFNGINSPLSYLPCCHIPATAGNASPPTSVMLCTCPCFAWWVLRVPSSCSGVFTSSVLLNIPVKLQKNDPFFLILQVLIPFLFLQSSMGFQMFFWDIPNFQYADKMSSFCGMAHFIKMLGG